MKRLILKSFQSPGDTVMLTAAVRDLHKAYPGVFQTDVRCAAQELWENNPHLTPLHEGSVGVDVLDMQYPLIHQSNQRPYHFIHGFVQFLEERLGLRIPLTGFHGDVHLAGEEKCLPPSFESLGVPKRFWILVAGGKHDFTAKWWNPSNYQQVVDHFCDRLTFVQCGENGHWHPKLRGVVDLVGKTTLRQFVRLMHHAEGVLCPVTFAMHLAAAVETRPDRSKLRPCVVIAGGREPPHWEAYPHHQFISNVGTLPCCADGGCWRSRCQLVGDGDPKDRENVCEQPIQVASDLRIPKCMSLISAADVIRRIEMYYDGKAPASGQLHGTSTDNKRSGHAVTTEVLEQGTVMNKTSRNVLIEFRHGLGDAVQLTIVLKHLRQFRPDWQVDVAALLGKHSAFEGLCRRVFILERDTVDRAAYDELFVLEWHECRDRVAAGIPGTKPSRCLAEVFGLAPTIDLFRYHIQPNGQAKERARRYLTEVAGPAAEPSGRFPVALLHYQGNTSAERKNLAHDLANVFCQAVLEVGYVPIILDWDHRSPLPDGRRIFNPGPDHELWGRTGTGDAATLAALIEACSLMVGVDSGPLHVAGATSTPTVGIWTEHHPGRYFDLSDNVLHLMPACGGEQLAPDLAESFRNQYQVRFYRELPIELPSVVKSLLAGAHPTLLTNRNLPQLQARRYGQGYYCEHKQAGLDYLEYGDWQRRYGRWFVDGLRLKGKKVLDVGCACGALLRGLGEAGAIVQGVEINEYMVKLGRDKWPDMAGLLHLCDAVNLHLFEEGEWDAVHTAQVAEHWKPELVPHILGEIHRIVKEGGLLFAALDTTELFERQGRKLADEDPTHICVRPLAWWHDCLRRAGWDLCTVQFENTLRDHPDSFLRQYDWDWFVARRLNVKKNLGADKQDAPTDRLVVGGKEESFGSDLSLRWVPEPHGTPAPVLYRGGKRVTKAWEMTFSYSSPADAHGGNANTH